MSFVGREFENAIQSLLSLSEEFASLQSQLDAAKSDLNMYDILYSVTKYIGSDPDVQTVLEILQDSVKGVFGASYSQVLLKNNTVIHQVSADFPSEINVELLEGLCDDILVINHLAKQPLLNINEGSIAVVRLAMGSESYGFLVNYWHFPITISNNMRTFLQIISTQVSMFLRSAKLVNEFKHLAILDPLTGIYNRSYFSNIEITSIPTIGESIILFDLDNFKTINDTKGHLFGDYILKSFAGILSKVSNDKDIIAFKFGGEEFIIKCYGGEIEAYRLAELVRTSFEAETGYTVSAGIATIGTSCKVTDYHHLVQLADDALYVSKQCGKNKTTLSTADIQILTKSGTELATLISKSFRQPQPTSLLRFKHADVTVVSHETFNKLQEIFNTIARVYDSVFITESLDVLLLIHGKVDTQDLIHRAKKILKLNMPDLKFEVHNLDPIFKEVVVHSSRVSELSQILGKEMGLNDTELNKIRLACEWHDVGKICTDPVIYGKTSKLTDVEYEVIKQHSWLSYSIAKKHPVMSGFSSWILYHHEDFNGSGYFGLVGDDIPYQAQIISIIDKFDALTEDRCYRPAYSWQESLQILKRDTSKFDPILFNTFEKMVLDMMNDPLTEFVFEELVN